MDLIAFTAHGALGAFDEVIFLGVAGLFLAMMGVSWFRSRDLAPELDEADEASASSDGQTSQPPASEDRFKLD
jgi:hypothetical protein